jgi:prenyltransferase beta subunit
MHRVIVFTSLIVAVLWLAAPAQGQTAAEKKATVAYLQSLQQKSGGFAASKAADQASVRATSSALRALKYFGGQVPDAKSAARFVESCFDKSSGGFGDTPGGKPDVLTTSIGLMAAAELKMDLDPYRNPAVNFLAKNAKSFEDIRIAAAALDTIAAKSPVAGDWIGEIHKLQAKDGTFGSGPGQARATGGAAVAVLRLGGQLDREAVLKACKAGQRPDGGFGKEDVKNSDLETSYRVMRLFWMLKDRPDADKIRGFIAKCRNADGGYGVAPGQPSNVGGTYFASIILHWLDEK